MTAEQPGPAFVYLASRSPRRRQLLAQIGVRHRLLVPTRGEDAEALEAERAGESPSAYVERVALAKLHAAVVRLERRGGEAAPVLSADTTVALGRRIIGKPLDAADATRSLRLLSGRTHRVTTAVAVGFAGRQWLEVSTSRVRFATIPETAIAAYVASGEPFGKAGGYAVQGALAVWIERIEGSYSGIMGLPLFETARLLKRVGIGGLPV